MGGVAVTVGIERIPGAPQLVSDDLGADTLSLELLTAEERSKVETALAGQRCDCDVCAALRGLVT
jgi:hypothetical protein